MADLCGSWRGGINGRNGFDQHGRPPTWPQVAVQSVGDRQESNVRMGCGSFVTSLAARKRGQVAGFLSPCEAAAGCVMDMVARYCSTRGTHVYLQQIVEDLCEMSHLSAKRAWPLPAGTWELRWSADVSWLVRAVVSSELAPA